MSDSFFDPYHVWLGIAPDEQPADHYRLLGIRRFEGNQDVISSAADRQMAHLKSFQIGARANDCQRLLNEVSTAAACLLAPQRKAAYDASLQPSPIAPLVSRSVKRNRPQSYPVASIIQIVLGGGLGLFVAVLTLFYFWGIDIVGKAKKPVPVAAKVEKAKPQLPLPKDPTPVAAPKPKLLAVPQATNPAVKPPRVERPPAPPVSPPRPSVEATPAPPIPMPTATPEGARKNIPHVDGPPMPTAPPVLPPKELTGDVLEIYNTHNWDYGGCGTKTCDIYLRLGKKVVWKQEGVAVAWDGKRSNPKTAVPLPDVKYDVLRIEITESQQGGMGGFAEIAIIRKGKNIALGKPVAVSDIYNPDSPHICAAEMVNDGIVDESSPQAGDGRGYWMLPNDKPGWVEILVTGPVAPRRRPPRR